MGLHHCGSFARVNEYRVHGTYSTIAERVAMGTGSKKSKCESYQLLVIQVELVVECDGQPRVLHTNGQLIVSWQADKKHQHQE